MTRKRARMNDLKVKFAALLEYKIWVKLSLEVSEDLGSERRTFFAQLLKDITEEEEEEAYEELDELWSRVSALHHFEYLYRDEDGGTEWMQHLLEEGIDILRVLGGEARSKYGHHIPGHFKPDPSKTFEQLWLNMMRLKRALREGIDVYKEWPKEVARRKYGHLITLMPRLPEGVVKAEDEERTVCS